MKRVSILTLVLVLALIFNISCTKKDLEKAKIEVEKQNQEKNELKEKGYLETTECIHGRSFIVRKFKVSGGYISSYIPSYDLNGIPSVCSE